MNGELGNPIIGCGTAGEKGQHFGHDETPTHGTAQKALRLVEDFPEPISEAQRIAFYRYTAYHVRRFNAIHRSTVLVQRGLVSLQSVRDRLERTRQELESSLQCTDACSGDSGLVGATEQEKPTDVPDSKRSKVEDANTVQQNASSRPRRGRLLRSAVFANMQSVLRTAKEESELYAQVAQNRQRIARQTQLHIVEEDLAAQIKLLQPLQEKMVKCETLERGARQTVVPALTLLHEMVAMEAQYPSSFFLRASGMEDSDGVCTIEPGEACGPVATGSCVAYDIPFAPAFYTAEAEDIIRSQVEEVLDAYLSYRSRIDPILRRIEEEKQVKHAHRVNQLMEAIGLVAGGGKDVIDLGLPSSQSGAIASAGDLGVLGWSKSGGGTSEPSKHKVAIISDSDSTDNDTSTTDVANATTDNDKKDRQLIQSALSALDDFEEMY